MTISVDCCKCGRRMEPDEWSRTWNRGVVTMELRCPNCGHVERVTMLDKR